MADELGETPLIVWLYHMTHFSNLQSIYGNRFLYSHKQLMDLALPYTERADPEIKKSRMNKRIRMGDDSVAIGECVPFYFVPLTPMFRKLCANRSFKPREQVFLCTSFVRIQDRVQWISTSDNANANRAYFRRDSASVKQFAKRAMEADPRSSESDDGRQAEFLVRDQLPVSMISRMGVFDADMKGAVERLMAPADRDRTRIEIERGWFP